MTEKFLLGAIKHLSLLELSKITKKFLKQNFKTWKKINEKPKPFYA